MLATAVRPDALIELDANGLAERLLGDAIYANPLMLGVAWQKGWIPLSGAALRRAMELNGVQVAANLAAFEWGRRAAHDLQAVLRQAAPAQPISFNLPSAGRLSGAALDAFIARRRADLLAYQGRQLADRYVSWVRRIRATERHVRSPHGGLPLAGEPLTEAVARQLFRLMAVKDEYEVARLLVSPEFESGLRNQFEGAWQVAYHLSLPFMRDDSGRGRKVRLGSHWRPALRLLSHLKFLRGSWFDPLGWTSERQAERAWLQRYEEGLSVIVAQLRLNNLDQALALARLPEQILGYGPIKQARMAEALPRWHQALNSFFQPS